jgi:hypothetical protein
VSKPECRKNYRNLKVTRALSSHINTGTPTSHHSLPPCSTPQQTHHTLTNVVTNNNGYFPQVSHYRTTANGLCTSEPLPQLPVFAQVSHYSCYFAQVSRYSCSLHKWAVTPVTLHKLAVSTVTLNRWAFPTVTLHKWAITGVGLYNWAVSTVTLHKWAVTAVLCTSEPLHL